MASQAPRAPAAGLGPPVEVGAGVGAPFCIICTYIHMAHFQSGSFLIGLNSNCVPS